MLASTGQHDSPIRLLVCVALCHHGAACSDCVGTAVDIHSGDGLSEVSDHAAPLCHRDEHPSRTQPAQTTMPPTFAQFDTPITQRIRGTIRLTVDLFSSKAILEGGETDRVEFLLNTFCADFLCAICSVFFGICNHPESTRNRPLFLMSNFCRLCVICSLILRNGTHFVAPEFVDSYFRRPDLCLRVVPPHGGGGGLWPVGGWVSLVWGNLAQSAYPPLGGGVWVRGWVGGRMARQPFFVHENTIFTERMVVKTGKSFRSAGSGDGTNTLYVCQCSDLPLE